MLIQLTVKKVLFGKSGKKQTFQSPFKSKPQILAKAFRSSHWFSYASRLHALFLQVPSLTLFQSKVMEQKRMIPPCQENAFKISFEFLITRVKALLYMYAFKQEIKSKSFSLLLIMGFICCILNRYCQVLHPSY